MSDGTPSGLMKRWPLIEGLVIALVALGCVVFQLRLPGKLVDERDYQAVAEVVTREAQPGDVILLAPWWTERARLFMPEQVPVVGYQGSEHDLLDEHPRVWLLAEPSLPGAQLDRTLVAFTPQRTEVGSERRFGNLSLRLFTNQRYRPTLFSARDALAQAKVYLEAPDGQQQPCQWTGLSHRCGNAEVKVEWHEVLFAPRRCIRFYPPGGAMKLVAEFTNVPAADTIELLAGYTWDRGFFRDGVTSTELSLEVNGVRTALSLPPGLEGLQRVEAKATPPQATVRVAVWAQNANARDVCMELNGRGGAR